MSTRRRFMGGTAGIAATIAMAKGLTVANAAEPSRVQELAAAYAKATKATEEAADRADAIRDTLIARWGDRSPGHDAFLVWGHDPDYLIMRAIGRESDHLLGVSTDLLDELSLEPALTVADVRAKLAAVFEVWQQTGSVKDEEESEWHETLAWRFLEDAERAFVAMEARA